MTGTRLELDNQPVHIGGPVTLEGNLTVPEGAAGIVVFAHGSGSGRHSPRNRYVAERLNEEGLATLLMDLLTPQEERADAATGHLRFDIEFLAGRLQQAAAWQGQDPRTRHLRLGYFGASTGAAAALVAAARDPESVRAIVSRGGRPDLADRYLSQVTTPTLLLVGSLDLQVLQLNRRALSALNCEKAMEVINGATHLFEERGTLEEVARLAAEWFTGHLNHEGAGT